MKKFMISIGNQSYRQLEEEAENRDVKVQQLIRAVIVPDWIRRNLTAVETNHQLLPSLTSVYPAMPEISQSPRIRR